MKEVILSFRFPDDVDTSKIDSTVKELASKLHTELAYLGLISIQMRAAGHSRIEEIPANIGF